MPKAVCVVYGGTSAERAVSVKSGTAVVAALTRLGYQVVSLDLQENWAEQILAVKDDVDLLFNGLHGGIGEDGTLSAFCDAIGLKYTGSNMQASSLAMDKWKSKALFKQADIDVAQGKSYAPTELPDEAPFLPCIVKPTLEGSSIGIHLVEEASQWQAAKLDAQKFSAVLVEEYIKGREFAVPVYKNESLGVIEMIPNTDSFYTYEAKYAQGGSRHVVPAQIPADVSQRLQDMSAKAHMALGCAGISRSDFIWQEETNRIVILETNTLPGLTETSLVPEVAEACLGWSFDDLIEKMIKEV